MSNPASSDMPDLDSLSTEQKLDWLLLMLQNLPRTPLGPKVYNFHKDVVTALAKCVRRADASEWPQSD